MRVCPKCGHHDPWYWRGSGLVCGIEFCRFGDFKMDYPDIAEALLKAQREHGTRNFVFGKDYCYHVTKGLNVERQSLIENPYPEKCWHIPVESAKTKPNSAFGLNPFNHGKQMVRIWKPDPNQTKLLEVAK